MASSTAMMCRPVTFHCSQLDIARVSGFVQRVDHSWGGSRRRCDASVFHAARRVPRGRQSRTRDRTKAECLASGEHLVFDGPTQDHVQEILDVLVAWNDARRNAETLEGKARPPSGRARQRGASMQEWLHPAMAHHFDSGNDEAIAGGPCRAVSFVVGFRHDRKRDAENPHTQRSLLRMTQSPTTPGSLHIGFH